MLQGADLPEHEGVEVLCRSTRLGKGRIAEVSDQLITEERAGLAEGVHHLRRPPFRPVALGLLVQYQRDDLAGEAATVPEFRKGVKALRHGQVPSGTNHQSARRFDQRSV